MKHPLLLLSCSLVLAFNCFAQFNIKKQKTIGGSSTDYLTIETTTSDKGYIVAGASLSESGFEKSQNSRGYYDFWVVKIDSVNKIQWERTIGGDSMDYPTAILQTRDGGFLIGGFSNSAISGEKTQSPVITPYATDYWLVKLDRNGKKEWDKVIGGDLGEELYCLRSTGDGGFILGGTSNSNISGNKSENSRGGFDFWLVKLDSSCNVLWDKTIGGNREDILISLDITTDGGYIVGGWSGSGISGEKSESRIGKLDYWVLKLDSTGNITWQKTIGGNKDDYMTTVKQTSGKGYILGGYTGSNISGTKSQTSRGEFDYWIVKLNALGNIEWDRTIGGNGEDQLSDLNQTKDGGFLLVGSSSSNISGEKTEDSKGGTDIWVVKINRSGRMEWNKVIGGAGEDWVASLKEISKNHYLIGGYSASSKSGDKSQNSRGDFDYWPVIIELKPTIDGPQMTVTNILEMGSVNSKTTGIYPNPVKDILHISSPTKANYTLTSQSGVTVLTQMISGKGEMNVSRLQAGVYYLKNNSTGEVQKIVVQ